MSAPATIKLPDHADSSPASDSRGFLSRNLAELYVFRFAISNVVANNLRKRYNRSVLGFLWTLLNPLMMMTTMAVAFSLAFKMELRTFSMYIFSGLIPWNFLASCLMNGSQSLLQGEGLLKKVYIPKLFFPLSTITTELVNFFFTLISLYSVALAIGLNFSTKTFFLPLAVLILYLMGLGMAMILSVAMVYFRDLNNIVQIMVNVLMFSMPIMYPLEAIDKQYHYLFTYNPFYYFITLFRKIFLSDQTLSFQDFLTPLIISLVAMVLGLLVVKWRDRDLIYRL